MPKPESHRIRFRLGAELVHETFIGEGVLYSQRRSQRPGEEWRSHGVRKGAFTANRSSASAGTVDAPGEVGWHGVALIPKFACRRFSRTWFQRLRLIAKQHPADDVSRAVIARPVSQRSYPILPIPNRNVSVR